MEPQEGLKRFEQSYLRLGFLEDPLAIATALSSLVIACSGDRNGERGAAKQAYLAAGLTTLALLWIWIIATIPPSDRIIIKPNKEDAEIKQFFRMWGRLHAVRTTVSILVFTGLISAHAALETAKT
ncbi:hypothetical protein COCOBI_12-5340 [Coccomyxa sp. Obi]|nr:hypothetical protein COCOBI_12-5340 [Coccomyxa sp. Obi]